MAAGAINSRELAREKYGKFYAIGQTRRTRLRYNLLIL
jgi:hypothetical protein